MRGYTRSRGVFGGRRYLLGSLSLALCVFLVGWALNYWISGSIPVRAPADNVETSGDERLRPLFDAAVQQMQQGDYRQALALWHQAMLAAPEVAEIKVNTGFTLFELGDFETARNAFIEAMELNAYQANAYYGLAITSEKLGDIEAALGAMRSYIHLAPAGEEDRFVRRARAALWEWEALIDERSATDAGATTGSGASVVDDRIENR